jgi:ubiquinone/menaquinone biosynthesis C-methylase UbiE
VDVAEFDKFADEYYTSLAKDIGASGETPEFFAEYKVRDVGVQLQVEGARPRTVLDFGSGVGYSVPYFRKYFPDSELTCTDVSQRSLDLSRQRNPGTERYVRIVEDRLPLADNSFDLVFSACVFHHIPHEEHLHWLTELNRVTAPDGRLFIFEHNPFNPLTRSVVRTCAFDENARLINGPTFSRRVSDSHWSNVEVRYRIFFPRMLRILRSCEPYLCRVPFGAQYCVSGQKKPDSLSTPC